MAERRDGRALVVLATTCLLWGTIPLTIEGLDLPAVAITAARCWLAALALGGTLLVGRLAGRAGRRRAEPAPPTVPRSTAERLRVAGLAVLAGAILVAHWTLQFAAYDRAPASTVAFVIYLAPIGVAALAPLVLHEATTARTAAAIGVAVVGAALLTGASDRGDVAGLLSAAGSALGLVALLLVAKPLARLVGGLRAACSELAVAAVLLAVPAVRLLAGGDGPLTGEVVLRLLVLGLVHTALFVSVQLWCLARVPAATAGVIGQLEPVGVVLVSALAGAAPSASTLVGGLAIVGAGVLAATAPHRTPPTVPLAVEPAMAAP